MKKKLQLMSKKYNHEEHYAQLQVNKLNNQEEINKIPRNTQSSKTKLGRTENQNRLINSIKVGSDI